MKEKSTFNRNFDKAIIDLMVCDENEVHKFNFILLLFKELVGKESSKDDFMRLVVLANNRTEGLKSYDEVINFLSAGDSNYPLWINISKFDDNTIRLEFSMRFRSIKTSHSQETGYPPFKVIK